MEDTGHGHSVAAWTGVTILLVAATLLSLAVFFSWSWAAWVGIGLGVVGVAAWYGLNAAGYGEQAHDEDVADQGSANH
jgi:hypothetical protein